jgi:hypothetical protein
VLVLGRHGWAGWVVVVKRLLVEVIELSGDVGF